MAEDKEVTCGQCHQTFPERQMRMQQFAVEFCPICGTQIRQTENFGFRNETAIVLGDLAAIDAWLENHSKATGVKVQKREHTERTAEHIWSVQTSHGWPCEVAYNPANPNFVALRLISTKNGAAVLSESQTLQRLCADRGAQPTGYHSSEVDAETGSQELHVWGAQQHLSTYTLCEELFEPILSRLASAMNAVDQHFGQNSGSRP